jgi:hypothetical protein
LAGLGILQDEIRPIERSRVGQDELEVDGRAVNEAVRAKLRTKFTGEFCPDVSASLEIVSAAEITSRHPIPIPQGTSIGE